MDENAVTIEIVIEREMLEMTAFVVFPEPAGRGGRMIQLVLAPQQLLDLTGFQVLGSGG